MNAANAMTVKKALQNGGLSGIALNNAMKQTAHETAGYTSKLLTTHNNASGIKFAGQEGAVKGSKSTGNSYYAKFDSLDSWAKAYIKLLSKGSKPIDAKTDQDFAERLKKNGYYEDTVINYLKGLTSWGKQLNIKSVAADSTAVVITFIVIGTIFYFISKIK